MTQEMLFPLEAPAAPAPEWERIPGVNGGTCGASHVHTSGWTVQHCGHPTANFPYFLISPEGDQVLSPNGRGFQHLDDAKMHVKDKLRRYSVYRSHRAAGGKQVDTTVATGLKWEDARAMEKQLNDAESAANPTKTTWTRDLFLCRLEKPERKG